MLDVYQTKRNLQKEHGDSLSKLTEEKKNMICLADKGWENCFLNYEDYNAITIKLQQFEKTDV